MKLAMSCEALAVPLREEGADTASPWLGDVEPRYFEGRVVTASNSEVSLFRSSGL